MVRKKSFLEKLIISVLTILIVFNFICANTAPVKAGKLEDTMSDLGKLVLDVVILLILSPGDGVMYMLQSSLMDPEQIVGTYTTLESVTASVPVSNEDDSLEVRVPVMQFTPVSIFTGEIPLFDIDYFDSEESTGGTTGTIKSSIDVLKPIVATWYKTLRMMGIVGSLIVLIYIGIRIVLSSAGSNKAKYKEMLKDWIVGFCLFFLMHYIMAGAVKATGAISETLSKGTGQYYVIYAQLNDSAQRTIEEAISNNVGGCATKEAQDAFEYLKNGVYGVVTGEAYDIGLSNKSKDEIVYDGNNGADGVDAYVSNWDIGKSRFLAGQWNFGYIISYYVIVAFTLIFSWIYVKRTVTIAFLTMIAPIVAFSYPLDKVGDGTAQGFQYWLKEYIYNCLTQPIHLLLYTVLVSSAQELAEEYIIYMIVVYGCLMSFEKIFRRIFGLDKASMGPNPDKGTSDLIHTTSHLVSLAGNAKNLIGGKKNGGSGKEGSGGEGEKPPRLAGETRDVGDGSNFLDGASNSGGSESESSGGSQGNSEGANNNGQRPEELQDGGSNQPRLASGYDGQGQNSNQGGSAGGAQTSEQTQNEALQGSQPPEGLETGNDGQGQTSGEPDIREQGVNGEGSQLSEGNEDGVPEDGVDPLLNRTANDLEGTEEDNDKLLGDEEEEDMLPEEEEDEADNNPDEEDTDSTEKPLSSKKSYNQGIKDEIAELKRQSKESGNYGIRNTIANKIHSKSPKKLAGKFFKSEGKGALRVMRGLAKAGVGIAIGGAATAASVGMAIAKGEGIEGIAKATATGVAAGVGASALTGKAIDGGAKLAIKGTKGVGAMRDSIGKAKYGSTNYAKIQRLKQEKKYRNSQQFDDLARKQFTYSEYKKQKQEGKTKAKSYENYIEDKKNDMMEFQKHGFTNSDKIGSALKIKDEYGLNNDQVFALMKMEQECPTNFNDQVKFEKERVDRFKRNGMDDKQANATMNTMMALVGEMRNPETIGEDKTGVIGRNLGSPKATEKVKDAEEEPEVKPARPRMVEQQLDTRQAMAEMQEGESQDRRSARQKTSKTKQRENMQSTDRIEAAPEVSEANLQQLAQGNQTVETGNNNPEIAGSPRMKTRGINQMVMEDSMARSSRQESAQTIEEAPEISNREVKQNIQSDKIQKKEQEKSMPKMETVPEISKKETNRVLNNMGEETKAREEAPTSGSWEEAPEINGIDTTLMTMEHQAKARKENKGSTIEAAPQPIRRNTKAGAGANTPSRRTGNNSQTQTDSGANRTSRRTRNNSQTQTPTDSGANRTSRRTRNNSQTQTPTGSGANRTSRRPGNKQSNTPPISGSNVQGPDNNNGGNKI